MPSISFCRIEATGFWFTDILRVLDITVPRGLSACILAMDGLRINIHTDLQASMFYSAICSDELS